MNARQPIARAIRAHPEDLGPPQDIRDHVVVLSNGPPADGCDDLASASYETQVALGVLIATACATEACQAECLRTAASGPRYFFTAADALASTMRQAVSKPCGLAATDMVRPQCGFRPLPEVDVRLAEGMTLLPDSAEPPLTSHGPDFRALSWRTPFHYGRTMTITYAVRPRALGDQPVYASASGIWNYDEWSGASFA